PCRNNRSVGVINVPKNGDTMKLSLFARNRLSMRLGPSISRSRVFTSGAVGMFSRTPPEKRATSLLYSSPFNARDMLPNWTVSLVLILGALESTTRLFVSWLANGMRNSTEARSQKNVFSTPKVYLSYDFLAEKVWFVSVLSRDRLSAFWKC